MAKFDGSLAVRVYIVFIDALSGTNLIDLNSSEFHPLRELAKNEMDDSKCHCSEKFQINRFFFNYYMDFIPFISGRLSFIPSYSSRRLHDCSSWRMFIHWYDGANFTGPLSFFCTGRLRQRHRRLKIWNTDLFLYLDHLKYV